MEGRAQIGNTPDWDDTAAVIAGVEDIHRRMRALLANARTDLVSVELRRAHLIVSRILREVGVSDEVLP
jgi:hypothetical protein